MENNEAYQKIQDWDFDLKRDGTVSPIPILWTGAENDLPVIASKCHENNPYWNTYVLLKNYKRDDKVSLVLCATKTLAITLLEKGGSLVLDYPRGTRIIFD